jgi:hypothetical protein
MKKIVLVFIILVCSLTSVPAQVSETKIIEHVESAATLLMIIQGLYESNPDSIPNGSTFELNSSEGSLICTFDNVDTDAIRENDEAFSIISWMVEGNEFPEFPFSYISGILKMQFNRNGTTSLLYDFEFEDSELYALKIEVTEDEVQTFVVNRINYLNNLQLLSTLGF